jgi:Uncharacterized conserved protein
MVTSGWEFESSLGVMPTMKKIGVDGCKAGWIAAVKNSNWKVRLEVYPTIGELWKAHKDADCIAIDIPIGFRTCEDGYEERLCDKEARKALGKPRGSSVFAFHAARPFMRKRMRRLRGSTSSVREGSFRCSPGLLCRKCARSIPSSRIMAMPVRYSRRSTRKSVSGGWQAKSP